MQINNIYKKNVVKKPWGYEYLLYQNKNLAIWFLNIEKGQSTSMHCHSKKLTGLICLKGEAEISFLNEKINVKELNKVMIRRGLFHQSKAILEENICLIEVETPVDKGDLIRLKDQYGREHELYEKTYILRDKKIHPLITGVSDKKYFIENKTFEVKKIIDKEQLKNLNDKSIFIILSGGFKKKVDSKELFVLKSGDCLYSHVYDQIYCTLDFVCKNTRILMIS